MNYFCPIGKQVNDGFAQGMGSTLVQNPFITRGLLAHLSGKPGLTSSVHLAQPRPGPFSPEWTGRSYLPFLCTCFFSHILSRWAEGRAQCRQVTPTQTRERQLSRRIPYSLRAGRRQHWLLAWRLGQRPLAIKQKEAFASCTCTSILAAKSLTSQDKVKWLWVLAGAWEGTVGFCPTPIQDPLYHHVCITLSVNL